MSENPNEIQPVLDDETFSELEAEASVSASAYTLHLSKPFTYEGKEHMEFHFDFDAVNGYGCIAIEQELRAQGVTVPVREFSCEYQIRFAARACKEKVGVDVLMALSAKDFNRICNQVRSFLLR